MKCLFTIAGLQPEFGGPSQSVPALCTALAQVGVSTEIVSLDYGPAMGAARLPPAELVHATLVPCGSAIAQRMQWTRTFDRALRERCECFVPQILHDTGLWLATNHAAAKVSRQLALRRIVSPRGMLSTWALRHRGLKKRLAWWLYQKRDLETAHVLHATSAAEAQDFRTAGLRQPIAVIPNGVELPPVPDSKPKTRNSELRTLLFLGRIHPVKGLLDLIKAWAQLKPNGWRVVIAGRSEGGHQSELEAALKSNSLAKDFVFAGPVEGAAKWDLLRAADLFVLPSHSENFGIVVAEALACGVPVVATRGAPWEDLLAHRCGWWTAIGAEPLSVALREAIAAGPEVLREMGERGRMLVEQKFAWPGIGGKMKEVYEWMIGDCAKPDCVVT